LEGFAHSRAIPAKIAAIDKDGLGMVGESSQFKGVFIAKREGL
jgi:hypothetical protein